MKARSLHRLFASSPIAPLAVAIVIGACTPSGFDSPTKIASARVLATRANADESYAKPGDVVTLQSLVVDGRPNKPSPLVTYWVPFLCENPRGDLYYACFESATAGDAGLAPSQASDAGGDDAGRAPPTGSIASLLTPGTDVTALLPKGDTYTFTVPSDIIARHKPVPGTPAPYGLVILFNIACAGHVKIVGVDPTTGSQQVPLGCFDDQGNALTANDYVIGFTRVYAYDDRPNANPEIDGILFDGAETPTNRPGTALPTPVDWTVPACHGSCNSVALTVDVPDSSWEEDRLAKPSDPAHHEAIWVDFYAEGGSLSGEARLVFDAIAGRISGKGSEVKYAPPDDPGEATLWAVVHDSRDGVTWLQVNVHAQ